MVENAVKTICPKNLLPPPFGLIHRTHLKVEVWQQRPEKQRQCTFIGCTNVLPIYTNTHGKMWFLHKTKSLIYCLLVSPAQHLLPFWLCNGMWSTQLCGSSLTSLVGCTTSPSPVGAEGRIPAQADWSPPSFVKTHVQRHEFREAIRIILSVKSFRMKYIAPFPSTFLSFYLQPPPKNNPRLATCFQ